MNTLSYFIVVYVFVGILLAWIAAEFSDPKSTAEVVEVSGGRVGYVIAWIVFWPATLAMAAVKICLR